MANNGQESAQIAVTVILKSKSTFTNTATVSSQTTDPDTVNNAAALTVTVGGSGGGKK